MSSTHSLEDLYEAVDFLSRVFPSGHETGKLGAGTDSYFGRPQFQTILHQLQVHLLGLGSYTGQVAQGLGPRIKRIKIVKTNKRQPMNGESTQNIYFKKIYKKEAMKHILMKQYETCTIKKGVLFLSWKGYCNGTRQVNKMQQSFCTKWPIFTFTFSSSSFSLWCLTCWSVNTQDTNDLRSWSTFTFCLLNTPQSEIKT